MFKYKLEVLVRTIAVGFAAMATAQALAGDGTLPVRLPGDGTLPTLVGDAKDLAQPGVTVPTKVKFTQLITQSIDGGSSAFRCRDAGPGVSQHQARGTLSVGNATYNIKGVCYNSATSDMEIVADQAQNNASLVSPIQPSTTLARLHGRLMVKTAPAARYTVDLKDPNQSRD